jgi:hypothetical protein
MDYGSFDYDHTFEHSNWQITSIEQLNQQKQVCKKIQGEEILKTILEHKDGPKKVAIPCK